MNKDTASHIISFLELADIANLIRLNKAWYQLIMNNDQIWRRFCDTSMTVEDQFSSRKYYQNVDNYQQEYKKYMTSVIKTIKYQSLGWKTMLFLQDNHIQIDNMIVKMDDKIVDIIDVNDRYIFIITTDTVIIWNKKTRFEFNYNYLYIAQSYSVIHTIRKVLNIDGIYVTLADDGYVDSFKMIYENDIIINYQQLATADHVADIYIENNEFILLKQAHNLTYWVVFCP